MSTDQAVGPVALLGHVSTFATDKELSAWLNDQFQALKKPIDLVGFSRALNIYI